MMATARNNEYQLVDELLRRTSRSFYLTLRFLPQSIRWPISLAYLLARSTDTVADLLKQSVSVKLSVLTLMQEMINSGPNSDQISQLQSIMVSITPDFPEHSLLMHFAVIIKLLYQLDADSRADIIQLLNTITEGQRLDIERFTSNPDKVICLQTIDELDRYTYLVAGCVGEYWTKVSLKHIGRYSDLSAAELQSLAIAFGKGLQLVNILRDIPQDLAQGRCYLPHEQLQQQNLLPERLLAEPERLEPLVQYWWSKARADLQQGWKYMLSIQSPRMRWVIAMPLLLGFATLQTLRNPLYLQSRQPVKLNRRQVKMFMLIAGCGMISRKCFALTRWTPFSPIFDFNLCKKIVDDTGQSKSC